jgi:hypothetical protein
MRAIMTDSGYTRQGHSPLTGPARQAADISGGQYAPRFPDDAELKYDECSLDFPKSNDRCPRERTAPVPTQMFEQLSAFHAGMSCGTSATRVAA